MDREELLWNLEDKRFRLQELTEDDDYEAAHSEADGVLVETIKLLAEANFGTIPCVVTEIIEEYNHIPKW